MKRYVVLFAIFITAIFFYPVFAHADKIDYYFAANPISPPVALFVVGFGLLKAASVAKHVIKKNF